MEPLSSDRSQQQKSSLNISRLTFLYSARQKDYLITPYITFTCYTATKLFFIILGESTELIL